jgi:prepilin-type N-terminal cleavage/methylation domain-containing protein
MSTMRTNRAHVSRGAVCAGVRGAARRVRRAFSLIEMLIALAITSTILSATLVAFDAMYKVYDTATDSASNHVVARITVNRLLGMIRTGSDFGPFPADVLDRNWNPLKADYFEFASAFDEATGEITEITRVEYRFAATGAANRVWRVGTDPPIPEGEPTDGTTEPGELWLVVIDLVNDIEQEFLMLSDVRSATFTLEYDIGPRLVRGTVDITFEPTLAADDGTWTPATPETVRLVASAIPRRSISDE